MPLSQACLLGQHGLKSSLQSTDVDNESDSTGLSALGLKISDTQFIAGICTLTAL